MAPGWRQPDLAPAPSRWRDNATDCTKESSREKARRAPHGAQATALCGKHNVISAAFVIPKGSMNRPLREGYFAPCSRIQINALCDESKAPCAREIPTRRLDSSGLL